MKYFYNATTKSSVVTRNPSFKATGYEEINEASYKRLQGAKLTPEEIWPGPGPRPGNIPRTDIKIPSAAKPEVVETDPVEEVVKDEVKEVERDILDDILDSIEDEGAEEEPSRALEPDSSVIEQDEADASNSFETIADLRAFGDTSLEGRVTKNKAHGVYSYDAEKAEWVRTGDL